MSCNLYTLHCEKEINNDILQSIAGPARLFNNNRVWCCIAASPKDEKILHINWQDVIDKWVIIDQGSQGYKIGPVCLCVCQRSLTADVQA